MQYEHQSERFHRIRFAYPQLLVTSLVPNQRPIKGHGTYPTHNYKVDCASKHTVQGKTSKSQAATCIILPRNAWLLYPSALVNNCFDFDTSYLELVQSRVRHPDQQESKLCNGREISGTALLEPLQLHIQSGELLHMAYFLPLWKF